MDSWTRHYFDTAFGDDEPKREIFVDDMWATRSTHMRRLRGAGETKKEALKRTRDLPPSRVRELDGTETPSSSGAASTPVSTCTVPAGATGNKDHVND